MFNALRYAEELEKAGFSRSQAETSVRILIDVMNENFATKPDIHGLETKIDTSVRELETKIDTSVRELETKIDTSVKKLETKIDMSVEHLELRMDATEQRLETKIDSVTKEIDSKLTIKLGAMLALSIGLVATLLRLFQG